jgi:hypothetical protein
MKYQLKVSSEDGVKDRYAEFNESEGVRGDVVVSLGFCGESREWIIKDANIPLFISNLICLLKETKERESVFAAQFSPNCNAIMREGRLLLSRFKNERFDEGIFDRTDPRELVNMRRQIIADASRFGIFSKVELP